MAKNKEKIVKGHSCTKGHKKVEETAKKKDYSYSEMLLPLRGSFVKEFIIAELTS